MEVPGQVPVRLFRNQDSYPRRTHTLKADVSDGPPVKHLAVPSALLLKSESVSMSRTSDNRQTYVLPKSPSHQTFPAEPPSCSAPVLLSSCGWKLPLSLIVLSSSTVSDVWSSVWFGFLTSHFI